MTKGDRRQRLSLTLLFSLIVFAVLVLALVIGALAVYLLYRYDLLQSTSDGVADINAVLLFMGFISLVIGTLLALGATLISVRPINKMVQSMNRLAAGDFSVRVEYGKLFGNLSIVRSLCTSFNTMAEELSNTEMLRSDFINNFSHEFKTPIVSIAGFAKLLKRGNLTPQQTAEYLDIIEEESLRLSAMATNVLSLTKVENQKILTGVTTFNLSEQLRSCVLLLEDKWDSKNIGLQLELGEYDVRANEELLKQVWINLLDNAIKFSPAGDTVSVRIEQPGDLLVHIDNHGPAIPAAEQSRIFQKFYQADTSHTAHGNGIGLAVVKTILDLHRGSVLVQSDDMLTRFTVRLPA